MDAPDVVKAHGVIDLPPPGSLGGTPRRYDLADRADRTRVYEQVLTEGTADDVRLYVVLAELIDLCQNLCCRTTSAAGGRDGSTRGAAS